MQSPQLQKSFIKLYLGAKQFVRVFTGVQDGTITDVPVHSLSHYLIDDIAELERLYEIPLNSMQTANSSSHRGRTPSSAKNSKAIACTMKVVSEHSKAIKGIETQVNQLLGQPTVQPDDDSVSVSSLNSASTAVMTDFLRGGS